MSDVTKIKYCPRCGGGTNSEDMGGTEYCFHCECGFIECEDVPELNRACDTQPQSERIASLESQLRAAEEREGKLRRVVDAAQKIRHWHDSHDGGMVVSGAKVRELWAALASAPTQGEGITDTELLDWLQEQITDTIYLDDGRIVDVKGGDVRAAIRASKESTHAD